MNISKAKKTKIFIKNFKILNLSKNNILKNAKFNGNFIELYYINDKSYLIINFLPI